MCRYQTTMSVNIPHMNSMQSIMWPQTLVYIHFTSFAYAPEKICLPCCAYMLHCTNTILYMQTTHYCTWELKQRQSATFNYYDIVMYKPITVIPLKCHIYIYIPHMPITSSADTRHFLYASYKLTAITKVTKITSIPNFTLKAYAPEQICLPHCTYMSNCISNVVHI